MGNQFHNRVAWLINNVSGNIYSDFLKGWVRTNACRQRKETEDKNQCILKHELNSLETVDQGIVNVYR